MRIGIVTITNNGPNYGNQLQNFAVLKFLEEIGISNSETLYNVEGAEYWCSFAHKIKNYVYVILKKGDYKKRLKELRFDSFGRKYLRYTKPIKGNVPVPLDPPEECGFCSRCLETMDGLCNKKVPPLIEVEKGHTVRCFLYGERDGGDNE